MNWSVDFAPLVPVWIVATLAIAGLLLVAMAIFGRAQGAALRLVALGLLVLAALNPSIRREDREPIPDVAVLIVDRSQSQTIDGRPGRTDKAEAHLKAEVAALGNTELRVATTRSGVVAGEDGTNLFRTLKEALADVPPERFAGALLVTDGQIHDVPAKAAEIGYDGPVHGLITGRRDARDRRIVLKAAPKFGIVGQAQTVKFIVEQTGPGNNAVSVKVSIAIDGGEPSEITVRTGVETEFDIPIEHGGNNLTEITVAPMQSELSIHNNRAVVITEGIRDRLRVLLISGEPHPGERTWRNLLKADASVDLVHFTILRPPEKQDGTPVHELSLIAFPARELFIDKLKEFDLIIFDRYYRRGVLPLAYMAKITGYVAEGGAVLVAAGPSYARNLSIFRTPLADVLPAVPTGRITEQPFRAKVTELGNRHPVTRDLPGGAGPEPTWGRWFRLIDVDARYGDIVMSGPDQRPLMLLARNRKGRVAQLMSDHAWLWARGYDGGGPQAEMLRRLAHWLMKEPELEEEALIGRQDGNQLIIERRTMAEDTPPVTVTLPSGETREVRLTKFKPGIWRGRVDVGQSGIHRLDDGILKAFSAIGSADPRESAEIHATETKLAPIARATRGGITWIAGTGANADRLSLPRLVKVAGSRALAGSGWLGLKANGAYRVRAVLVVPLTATLLALAALLLLLSGTWYREGR